MKEQGEVPAGLSQEIPNYKEIEDHHEAKAIMKSRLEEIFTKVEQSINLENSPQTKQILENAKQIIEDPKFMEQKGVRSIADQDARVGHKSKTSHFFGYKTEFMMTTEDRIITAVHVSNGAYVDGTMFDELLESTMKSGVVVGELYGDKAYFRKPILNKIKEVKAKAYIPVSEMAYRVNEDLFI